MPASRPARSLAAEDGLGMVEAVFAAAILLVGIVATLSVLDSSRSLVTTSERQHVAAHRAEQELERIRAIPFDDLELKAAPTSPTPGDEGDPRRHVVAGPPPAFDWDWSSASNPTEPLVIEAPGPPNPDAIVSRLPGGWRDGRYSGTLDVFVTTAGPDLKRVVVAVRLDQGGGRRTPVVASTLVTRQEATP